MQKRKPLHKSLLNIYFTSPLFFLLKKYRNLKIFYTFSLKKIKNKI